MAVWTVWEHDKFTGDQRAERAIFVRDSFSFFAFLFGPLWLLSHGMFVVLIAYLVVFGAANGAAVAFLGENAAGSVSLLLTLWFGFEARSLRRWALARRGWQLVAVVEGRRFETAERRYYNDRFAPPPPPSKPNPQTPYAPWGTRPTPPVLGLFPEGPR
ncbi:MAG: DUF2628 domain-containing protein [Pseudomonadota bacterium]